MKIIQTSIVVVNLTSETVIKADFALFVPTVLTQALVSVWLIFFRFFLQQIHHQNCLCEAEHHQTKNPNNVGR